MSKKTIFLCIAFWCLSFEATKAQTITLGNYCDFLNETQACCDEQAVGFNTQIIRMGEPGAYSYIALEESAPLYGISENDVAAYETWRGERAITLEEAIDPFLKINRPLRFVSGAEKQQQEAKEMASFSTPSLAGGLFFLSFLTGEGVPRAEERHIPETTFTAEEQEEITAHLQKAMEREEDLSVVEELLTKGSENWKNQLHLCQEQVESRESLAQAEANLRQVEEENSNKERSKNRLGKSATASKKGGSYLMMGGATLTTTGVLAPVGIPMIAAGALIRQGGEAVRQANHALGEQAIQAAAVQKKRASGKAEKIEEKGRSAEEHFLAREEELQTLKETLLKEELARTDLLAQRLAPQASWGAHEWQEWGENHGMSEVLVIKSQENREWLHSKTAELWEKRIQQSRLALNTVRRKIKKNLTPLERKSEFLWESVKQAKEEYERALAAEQALPLEKRRKEERRDELKSIAASARQQRNASQLNEGELLNYLTSEEKEEYRAILTWLQGFERNLQLSQENSSDLKVRWKSKEKVARRHHPTEQQEYYNFLTRIVENRVRADEKALRRYWPEADLSFRPYLKWDLLAPQELEKQEEELGVSEEIEAPLTLIEEIEAEGRRYWHQAQEMIKHALEERELPQTKEHSETQEESVKSFDLIPFLEEPQESLISWSLEQMNHPTEWDKKRWKARAELEQALSEARKLKSFIASLGGETLVGDDKTTLGTEIGKREPDQRTVSSFGGSRTASILGTHAPLKMTFEGLRVAYDQAAAYVNEKKSIWEKAVQETERYSGFEEQPEESWKKADQMVLENLLSTYSLTIEKETARKLEKSWDTNLKRWRIFKRADDLAIEIEQKKKEREDYDLDSHEYGVLSATIDKLEKEYHEEMSNWEKELGSKATTEEERKKYEGKDQRVLNRWNRFVERNKKESNVDNDKSETKGSILVRTQATEKDALEDAEKDTPGAQEYWKEIGGALEKLFTKEKSRLDRIEKIWESIAKAQEEVLWTRCRIAAEYYEAHPTSWKEELRPQDRDYYNKEVARRNREEPLAKEEEELKELQGILNHAKEALEERKTYVEGQIAKGATTPGRFLRFRKSYSAEKQELEKKIQELATSPAQKEYDYRLEALQKKREERQKLCDFRNKDEQERREFIEKEIIRREREKRIEQDRKKANECRNRAKITKEEEIVRILKGYHQWKPGAAWAYEQAIEADSTGDTQLAKLYRQYGEAYEKQAEALLQEDKIEAKKREEIAEVLREVFWVYKQGVEAESTGSAQAVELYRQSREAYEKQIEALEGGDETEANRQKGIAEALKNGAGAYTVAESEDNFQFSRVCYKFGELCTKLAKALEQEDEKEVIKQGKITEVLDVAADVYKKATEAESKENPQLARLYRQCGEACEKQAEALERENKIEAKKWEKIVGVLHSAIEDYEGVIKAESKGDAQIARLYRQCGEAYEKEAIALERGDVIEAIKWEKIASVLHSAIEDYQRVIKAESKGDAQAAKLSRQRGEACERGVEALERGDEAEANKQKKLAITLSNAVWAHEEAVKAESKGNAQLTKLSHQRGEIYKKQVAALERGDEAEALKSEKIIEILEGATDVYKKATEAESNGSVQAARIYRQCGEVYEKQAEALEKEDETEVNKQKKIIEILENAGKAYEGAVEAEAKGNIQVAKLYHQHREIYEKQAEALVQENDVEVIKQDKIVEALEDATDAYKEATETESKGKVQLAKLYRQCGEIYEKQVEALERGDQAEAEKWRKTAGALSSKAWAYEQAAEAALKGNIQLAKLYHQQEEAYKKEAEALERGDEVEAKKWEKIADMLSDAVLFFKDVATAESNGNSQLAKYYCQCGEAYEKQAEALERGDEVEIKKWEKVAKVLERSSRNEPVWAYEQAAEAESKGNIQVAKLYRQYGEAYEKQVEALEGDDGVEAKKWEKIAKALSNISWDIAGAYEQAAIESEGNTQSAGLFRQCREAYERQIEALERGDEAEANKWENIAGVLRNAAWAYNIAAGVESDGKTQIAELFRESGKAYEKQVEVLEGGNEREASKQRKIAEALENTARAYEKAADEELDGNTQVAGVYRKCAEAYEKQTAAFMQENESEASKQEKVVIVLKEAIRAYEGEEDVIGEAYEKKAEALERGDEGEVAKQQKIVRALRGAFLAYGDEEDAISKTYEEVEALERGDKARGNKRGRLIRAVVPANWIYENLAKAESTKNFQVAKLYHQCGEAYERQVQALARGDEVEANKQENIAETVRCMITTYRATAEAESTGCFQVAKAYHRCRKAYERQIEALLQGDETAVNKQKEIAEALGKAAWTYKWIIEEGAKENTQIVRLGCKLREAYEKQAAALEREDEAEVNKQKKIIEVSENVARAYEEEAEEKSERDSQAAKLYRELLETYEKQIEAIERGDEAETAKWGKTAEELRNAIDTYK